MERRYTRHRNWSTKDTSMNLSLRRFVVEVFPMTTLLTLLTALKFLGVEKGANRITCWFTPFIAERAGFEPAKRFWRLHTFQACLFNHSSTSPLRFSFGATPKRPRKDRNIYPFSQKHSLYHLLHLRSPMTWESSVWNTCSKGAGCTAYRGHFLIQIEPLQGFPRESLQGFARKGLQGFQAKPLQGLWESSKIGKAGKAKDA